MIFKLQKKAGNCCFEYWDKIKKQLAPCAEKAFVSIGKDKFVCRNYLREAIARSPGARMVISLGKTKLSDEETMGLEHFIFSVDNYLEQG